MALASFSDHQQVVQLLDVGQVAERLAVSRSSVYVLLSGGALPSVKVGGARRVAVDDLNRYVDGLRQSGDGASGGDAP